MPQIGLIGGTGPQGRGIALRWAMAGQELIMGSRQEEKALRITKECNDLVGSNLITGMQNEECVENSDVVFLTIPFEFAERTLKGLLDKFQSGSIFVDVTVPLVFGKVITVEDLPQGSASQLFRTLLPEDIPVTGAFKTISAHALEDIETPLDRDTFIIGDKKDAKKTVMELIDKIPTLRPVDAGGLEQAGVIERMTALSITINKLYKVKDSGWKVML